MSFTRRPSSPLPLLALFCITLAGFAPATERKPNIIVIIADDLGYSDVGFNGSAFHQTPHIDQLATEGVRFDHGYSPGTSAS